MAVGLGCSNMKDAFSTSWVGVTVPGRAPQRKLIKFVKDMLLLSIFIIGIQSIFNVLNNTILKTSVRFLLPLNI